MKQVKTVYLYAPNSSLNINISSKELNCRYKIIKSINSVQQLYSLDKNSVDYLIIFANRKKINNLDKHQLNYLSMIFNKVIVVAKAKVNVLSNYTFIPKQVVNNNLQVVFNIIETLADKTVCYTYDTFSKNCLRLLKELGFNLNHKGTAYIVDCAYNIASIFTKGNLYSVLYSSIANKFKTTIDCVERCIRSAINYAVGKQCFNKQLLQLNQNKLMYSNKNIIKAINKCVINNMQ